MLKRVTLLELALVLLWSVAVMALTALPYKAAQKAAGPGQHFAGFLWGVDEGNVYLQWIRQASEGRFLLRNQYTVKYQSPHFVNVFLWSLGRVCAHTGMTPQGVFAGARYVCGVFCLLCLYLLAAELTADRRARAAALALASLSSGLGWVVVLMGQGGVLAGVPLYPIDVADGWQAQPEAVTFLCLLLNPLFSFATGLLALTLLQGSRLTEPEAKYAALWTGLLLLLLGNVHGYDIIPVHLALLLWLTAGWWTGRVPLRCAVGRYVVVALVSAASPLWAQYTARVDPAYLAKISTPTLTARPVDLAVGYGLVLLLALGGVWALAGDDRSLRRRVTLALWVALALAVLGLVLELVLGPTTLSRLPVFALPLLVLWVMGGRQGHVSEDRRAWFLVAYVAAVVACLYLPVSFQRKMIEGLHLGLSILGGFALASILGHRKSTGGKGGTTLSYPVRAMVVGAIVVATVPSNLLFVQGCLRQVAANIRNLLGVLAPPMFLSDAEVEAMKWLGRNCTEDDILLSSSLTGCHVPAYARCLLVIGHWAETLDFPVFAGDVGRFYQPASPVAARETLLSTWNPRFVWWGPQERVLQEAMTGASPADPCEGLPGLRLAYHNAEVRIYERTP